MEKNSMIGGVYNAKWMDFEKHKILIVNATELRRPYLVSIVTWWILPDGTITESIVVDSIFKSLSQHTRNFMLLHEVGHIIHGDLGKVPDTANRKKTINLSFLSVPCNIVLAILRILHIGKYFRRELEADAYAVKNLGKDTCITALNELRQITGVNQKEIDYRINVINETS